MKLSNYEIILVNKFKRSPASNLSTIFFRVACLFPPFYNNFQLSDLLQDFDFVAMILVIYAERGW